MHWVTWGVIRWGGVADTGCTIGDRSWIGRTENYNGCVHCGCLVDVVLGAALFVDVTVCAVPIGLSIALVLLPVLLGL